MENCIFCKLRDDKNTIIYQNKECFVVLDKYPIEKGHLLVISNEHYKDMLEAPKNVVESMSVVSKEFASKLKVKLGAEGINIGTNIGKEAGQKIMHFHIHVIPRYHGKGRNFNFGHNPKISEGESQALIEKLR
ncbi:MAG: HIT family protein [Candidatus Micrarchaeia archaeon]